MARLKKKVRNRLICWVILSIMLLGRIVPRRLMLYLMGNVGMALSYILRESRKKALKNLETAFPFLSPQESSSLATRVFKDMGRNLVDVLRLPFMSVSQLDRIIRVRGKEFLDSALSRKKGAIVVTGHIGSWELLASYFSKKGYRVNALVKALFDPGLERIIGRVRESAGVIQIRREGALGEIFRALKRGEIVGILLDQDTKVEGTFVEFMGKEAFTPVGAVRVAMKAGAPIVPAAIRLEPDGKHIIEFDSELELTLSGNYAEDIRVNTEKCTKRLEAFIRKAPTQWVWMHDRWKTRPAEVLG